jgi:hypothetical protein
VAVLIPLIAAAVAATPVHAQARGPAETQDRFVGTGGLILPGSHPRRREVAECSECEWRLSTPCVDLEVGQAFSGTATCESVTRGCPDQHELVRVWFRRSGASWQDLGVVCLGEAGPITVSRIGQEVRDRLTRDLPGLTPRAQPARGVVTQLPVIFDSGQPTRWAATMNVLGLPTRVSAQPVWHWDFGDGGALRTTEPGGRYPDLSVSHVYRRTGALEVLVRADWSAEFTTDGLGPFPLPGTVPQTGGLGLQVGEGRALLVTPQG